jgi:hypothetical protein
VNLTRGPGAYVNTRRHKKNSNVLTNGKLEINRVDGGRKSVCNTGNVLNATIEIYGRLCAKKTGDTNNGYTYVLQRASDSYGSNFSTLDINSELNQSTEFMVNRKKSLEYRVVNVTTVFDYVRVPSSGDVFNRLLCWYTTDKVTPFGTDHENNVMKLNMYNNGIKQYGTVLNRNNMNEDNVSWIRSTNEYPGIIRLTVNSIDTNFLPGSQEILVVLGPIKVCVNVLFKETDTSRSTLMEKMLLIDKLEKEMNELKIQNEKLKRIGEKKQELNDLIEQVEP